MLQKIAAVAVIMSVVAGGIKWAVPRLKKRWQRRKRRKYIEENGILIQTFDPCVETGRKPRTGLKRARGRGVLWSLERHGCVRRPSRPLY